MTGLGAAWVAPAVVGPFCPSGAPSRPFGAALGTGMLCGGIGAWGTAEVETTPNAAVTANAAAARVKATRLKESENREAIRFFWFSVNASSLVVRRPFYRASHQRGYRFSVKKKQSAGFWSSSVPIPKFVAFYGATFRTSE